MAQARSFLARLWRAAPGLTLAFVAASLLALVFAARLTVATVYWSDPERRDTPLAGWMTPRYVVQSWTVPRDVVAAALELDQDSLAQGRSRTLARIAEDRNQPLEDLLHALQAAIDTHRADQQ